MSTKLTSSLPSTPPLLNMVRILFSPRHENSELFARSSITFERAAAAACMVTAQEWTM
jgi:hypothetical protein